ncbi:MAG: hypothetical protein ACOC1I_02130 [Spirochaetota bacterium]
MNRLAILLRLVPSESTVDRTVDRALELRGALERGGCELPLTWNLPSADVFSKGEAAADELRGALDERAERYGDTVAPMGLTGAPHAALHTAEIESDLEWALSNIWNSGAGDARRKMPGMIIPRSPAFGRRDALHAYGSSAARVGLLGLGAEGPQLTVVPNGEEGPSDLPAVNLLALGAERLGGTSQVLHGPGNRDGRTSALTRRALARAIRARHRSVRLDGDRDRTTVLLVPVSGLDDVAAAADALAVVDELVRRSGWEMTTLDEALASPQNPASLLAVEAPAMVPETAARCTELRRRRASKINTRRILELLATPAAATDTRDDPRELPERGRREFIASMLGQTSIPGTTVVARFSAGRLCGLHGAASAPGRDHPATSCVRRPDGTLFAEVVESCFSFESEISRGLRSESVLADAVGTVVARIRTEYSFVGDYDALVATQHVAIEAGATGDTLCVLGEPIVQAGRCAITGHFTDGSSCDHEITWQTDEVVVWGEAFQIWDGESSHTLVPLTTTGHPCLWSVTALRDPERRVFLGGRYPLAPRGTADSAESVREHTLAFILVRGEIDHELVQKALAGRLPQAIGDEIAAGTAAETTIAAGRRVPREA